MDQTIQTNKFFHYTMNTILLWNTIQPKFLTMTAHGICSIPLVADPEAGHTWAGGWRCCGWCYGGWYDCTMYVPVTIARDDGTRPTETQASGESSAHTASHNTQPHHSHTPLYKNFIPGCPKISFNSRKCTTSLTCTNKTAKNLFRINYIIISLKFA